MVVRVNQDETVAATVARALALALERAVTAGTIPATGPTPDIVVERPPDLSHGDLSTNLAMRLGKAAGRPPRAIAEALVAAIDASDVILSADVAGPGFVNIRLQPAWLAGRLQDITAAGETWGDVAVGSGRSVQLEFVSANPTGPLTLGATRGAALGDALANILGAAGYRTEREYYVNDAGSRMQTFYAACAWYYRQLCGVEEPPPDDAYPAAEHSARLLHAEHGSALLETADDVIGAHGVGAQLAEIRQDLERLGLHFDSWFHEQRLFDEGLLDAALQRLRDAGAVEERDGAVWFAATRYGLDKDEVLVRSNGMPTYFMSDIAYHIDKLETRAFDTAIAIWGADHHGHVARMHAVLRALGIDDHRLTLLITQFITVGGAKMKKAHGNYVTLAAILEQVGADAIRFFLTSRAPGSTIDFDLDLAVRAGNENPVYYVQMAHARCAGVARQAEQDGIDAHSPDLGLLGTDEAPLILLLLELPEVVTRVARDLEPHRLNFYAQAVAAAWHRYYHDHRIVDPAQAALSAARLHLAAAVRVVLARSLSLLGMTAPERM